MGFVGACGKCCMCLSAWAVIQLSLMGVFYFLESPILIEDVEEHHYTDIRDFIEKTRRNYRQVALNCWITAGIYLITFFISIGCIKKASHDEKKKATAFLDDERVCIPKMPHPPQLLSSDTKESKKRRKLMEKARKKAEKGKPKEKKEEEKKEEKKAKVSHTETKTKTPEKAKKSESKVPSRPSSPKRKKEK